MATKKEIAQDFLKLASKGQSGEAFDLYGGTVTGQMKMEFFRKDGTLLRSGNYWPVSTQTN